MDEDVETFRVALKNNFERLWPHLGIGVTVGCFVGGGYGLAIGFGTLKCFRRTECVVVPSTSQVSSQFHSPMPYCSYQPLCTQWKTIRRILWNSFWFWFWSRLNLFLLLRSGVDQFHRHCQRYWLCLVAQAVEPFSEKFEQRQRGSFVDSFVFVTCKLVSMGLSRNRCSIPKLRC